MFEKRRTINPKAKRDRVLRSARTLFVKEGYYKVSIPVIVKTSGVSTGAIYNYFPNKESLARHLHEETQAEFHQMFLERLEGCSGTYEKLKGFAELVFDLSEADPEMIEYLFFMKHGEFLNDLPPLCFSESLRLLQSIVGEGIASGELRKATPFLSAIAFTGVIFRAAELRISCILDIPLPELAEELITNAWSSIAD